MGICKRAGLTARVPIIKPAQGQLKQNSTDIQKH